MLQFPLVTRFLVSLILVFSISAAHAAQKQSPAQRAAAKSGLGIAAVVDGDAITSYDVQARMRFVITTTKLTNSDDVIKRIYPQIIRSLIDEKLRIKEAANNNIVIKDSAVKRAIAAMEVKRNMKIGNIFKMLEKKKVPKETFIGQVRSQLAWNKLMIKKIRPKIKIDDEEIKIAQKRFSISTVNQELEIALLTLPVDKKSREAETRRLIEKLSGEMRAGASFEELSRQFSSAAAVSGGKIETFWVRPGQLDPVVAKALSSVRAGSITPPLRTPDGYTIVKVYNTRALKDADEKERQVEFKDILLKLKPDADNDEAKVLLSIGEEMAKNPGSCEEKGFAGIEDLDDFAIDMAMKEKRMSELSTAVRAIIEGLKIGDISAPFATDRGIQLYMLCGRKDAPPVSADIERVRLLLFQQKMELEAQKYIRNLRRDAYIEVR